MGIRMVIGYQAKETLQSRSPLKSAQFPRSILRFARQTMSHHCEVTAQFLAQSPPDKGNEGAIFFRFAGTTCLSIAPEKRLDPIEMPVIGSLGFAELPT